MKHLTHPLALAALALLALNDHYLKAAYHNALTGKLSDVAGVLLLPFFLKAVTRCNNWLALGITAVFFTWWKSPLSQPAIDAFNGLGLFHAGRVIDYTDLWALLALPLTYLALKKEPRTPRLPAFRTQNLAKYLVFPVCLLVLVATSQEDDFPFLDGGVGNCCLAAPLDLEVVGGRILVPSAFTPDGDGLNDTFFLAATEGVAFVDSLFIFALPDRDTVFFNPRITDFTVADGWDGSVNGTIPSASFEFDFITTLRDGSRFKAVGFVCSLPCPSVGEQTAEDAEGSCVFMSQLDSTDMRFATSIDSQEELPCY